MKILFLPDVFNEPTVNHYNFQPSIQVALPVS